MKTTDPARYFRNQTTPAARLARWQRLPLAARLAAIREHERPGYPCRPCNSPATMTRADWREALIHDPAFSHAPGPELSIPEAESPYLWIDGLDRSPLVLNYWAGRDFLNHRGWFTHDEDQDDTLEAYAVQLADFPGVIFEAIRCSLSRTVRVMLEDWHAIDYSEADSDWSAKEAQEDAARDAIRRADSTAKSEAEEEREHQAEEDRERQAEEARDDLRRNRATVRALIADLKELCPGPIPTMYPAAASAVKRQLADLLKDRSDLFDQLKTLEA